MTAVVVAIEPLAARHDRSTFTCGVETLDRYFREQAAQDVRRRIATCFVAIEPASEAIAGFYTLAATGIALAELPTEQARKLPRYPVAPAVLMGRLAVAVGFRRRGLGSALLVDALARTATSQIGAHALVVEAKDDVVADFYRRFGFEGAAELRLRLELPIDTFLRGRKRHGGPASPP